MIQKEMGKKRQVMKKLANEENPDGKTRTENKQ